MSACTALAIPLLCAAALAQSTDVLKIPRTPVHELDVKTPWVPPAKSPRAASAKPMPVGDPGIAGAGLAAALRSIPAILREQLLVAQEDDGTVWVRGADYKASFGTSGATFIPFLGSNAPRNHPVRFRLESVSAGETPIPFEPEAAAVLHGETIVFDRGSVREIYELDVGSIEQKFVLGSLPAPGDLLLRIGAESDLQRSEAQERLEFSNELGSVRYGKATAIDAAGASAPASTVHAGGGIEIRVPESFLAAARFPITIDPVISSFYILTDALVSSPDVAYDPTSDRYLAVIEFEQSAVDHDVLGVSFDSTGAYQTTYGIDFGAGSWTTPRVTGNSLAGQWLVVGAIGTFPRFIGGRTINAVGPGAGPVISISSDPSHDCFAPDVGGDPALVGPTYYCVVWERDYDPTDHDIHGRLVGSDSSLVGGQMFIENSGALDTRPSISKSDGLPPFDTQNWNVVWQREVDPEDHDIYGAQFRWDGFATTPAFGIDIDTDHDTTPTASSLLDGGPGPRNWLVAYTARYGDLDIVGRLMNGATSVDFQHLSFLEATAGSGTYLNDQTTPEADSDGTAFAVAYSEHCDCPAGDHDVYAATFTQVGSLLRLSEGHVKLYPFTNFAPTDAPRIASSHSGGGAGARFMSVCSSGLTSTHPVGDIVGALYDSDDFTSYCWPDRDGVRICPCGNPTGTTGRGCNNSSSTGGAVLLETGTASLAADTVQFQMMFGRPTALSIVAQFSGLNAAGTIFGQGVRCTNGTLKRLYAKVASGGAITAPQGGDLSVSARSAALGDVLSAAATRYYLVYYRDGTVLGGCPASSTFNSTQGGAITWRP